MVGHRVSCWSVSFVVLALVAAAPLMGCGGPGEEEPVSTVRIAITVVPTDVQCIRVRARGTRTVNRDFTVVPGASSVLEMAGLPAGDVEFTADAFAAGCGSLGPSPIPTWSSDPVLVNLAAGAVTNVNLVMRRAGSAAISIDFQDQPACPSGFSCGGTACAATSWGFESATAEGWAYDTATAGSTNASVGQVTSSTARANTGTRSLAIGFQGAAIPVGGQVFVKVPLCASGSALNLAGRTLQAFVRLETAPGTPPLDFGQGHAVALFTGPTTFTLGGDFSVDPATGGGATPGSWLAHTVDLSPSFGDISAVTHLGFRFLTNSPWTGAVYVDDVRLF